jgi:hypothetical protein
MIIFVDIDKTICTATPNDSTYDLAQPIHVNIQKINRLYDEGHTIVYWTARGSLTGINWDGMTRIQLSMWGCKYHEVRFNKPFYDWFIDDKALTIEDIENVIYNGNG